MGRRHRKNHFRKSILILLAVGLLIGATYSYFFLSVSPVEATVAVVEKTTADIPDKTAEPAAPEAVPEAIPAGEIEYLPESEGEIIRHTYYTLSFNSGHKQANWVYYSPRLGKDGAAVRRSDNFRVDPLVSVGCAKPSDYTKSGYDRGHLCPAGDMTHSPEAMSETFYMSNMSPQLPGFNRGIWKSLETQVREWSKKEPLYVVTGPVFKDNKGHIGEGQVTVPGYYYKVVYSPSRQQMTAYLLPNSKSAKKLTEYVVSVDSVETLTGIDFFPQLPDTLENRLEAKVCIIDK